MIQSGVVRHDSQCISPIHDHGNKSSRGFHKPDTSVSSNQKATKDRANVFDPRATPLGPGRLRAVGGHGLFEDVVMIDMQGKPFTNHDLEDLSFQARSQLPCSFSLVNSSTGVSR
jgi:hypothetical protein